VLVAVNRGKTEARVAVEAPAAWVGPVGEAITGEDAVVNGGRLDVVVPPRQARVY